MPQSAGNQFRPIPGLELGAPEVRVVPHRIRLADAGVSARELGDTIDAFNDGLRVAEITVDGKRIDLTLTGPNANVTSGSGTIQRESRRSFIVSPGPETRCGVALKNSSGRWAS